MIHYLHGVGRHAVRDWNHGLTAAIGAGGFGVMMTTVEFAGKLLGVAAILVGIACSVRREIRESRAARR